MGPRLAACLSSFLLAAVSLCAQATTPLEAACRRAGDNADELRAAWQAVPEAQRSALAFLLEHMTDADARTLSAGFLLRQVDLACSVRGQVPWGSALPDELFWNDVLPYAQANETREDWRSDFVRRFVAKVQDCKTPGEAALRLNATIFDELGVHYSTGRARADQAPSASIAQGKASCTGLSILLADACRACCVPARLVSVRWPHKAGNHTWVEVWDGARWRFTGADEYDAAGLDRGWFVGDAAQCKDGDHAHRVWAVSFAKPAQGGERFAAGWGRGVELWGVDVTARYVQAHGDQQDGVAEVVSDLQQDAAQDAVLTAQLERWLAADAERRATFEFDRNLDEELRTAAGDARLRALVFAAWKRSERAALATDHEQHLVRAGDEQSPFTVKQVGDKPAGGWPLVIAMHGGGNVAKERNDSQWRHMQVYYRDHPEVGGYLYCALRAPTDEWNGFYTDYFYPLLEKLIRQFVVCDDVDPDRVIAIGYSHGGYGAFAVGPKLPHRFAAVHASAAAPTDGESSPIGLHTLPFTFMVGGKDTAYGRRARCEAFAARLDELRRQRPGRYPGALTLVEDNGHTGLPDRDLLAQLVPAVRRALPRELFWEASDTVVADHYWLHVGAPEKGLRIDARLDGQRLDVVADRQVSIEVRLDARLCDLAQELEVRRVVGQEPDSAAETRDAHHERVRPAPSLRVLCATMAERGDPALAASWILPLR
ncbi:MAG: hypothetical protein KDC48_04980 [Planctomycetes bacterium]|nr:hypothetical protein [Planctomycetota bacterium]